MIRIAIYDDTREHCEIIAAMLEHKLAERHAEVECFPSSGELLRYINEGHYTPDAAFLGVTLRDGDGVVLAEKLNKLVPSCRIVFLSDTLRDATEVYRAEHVWFILHEELENRLGPALEKALERRSCRCCRSIIIRGRGHARIVPLDNVLYLERDGRKTLVRAKDGEYVTSERPCQLLVGDIADGFIRSHMSYWVNRDKIESLERDEFVLCDGTRIPISRSWRASAKSAFLEGEYK